MARRKVVLGWVVVAQGVLVASGLMRLDEKTQVVSVSLDLGEEVIAMRRCMIKCCEDEDEDEEEERRGPLLRRVTDRSVDAVGARLGPWAKFAPSFVTRRILAMRRGTQQAKGGTFAKLAATRPVRVQLAAKAGWGAAIVDLGDDRELTTRHGCVVCAVGSTLREEDGGLRWRGGTLALAAPGAVLRSRSPRRVDIDEKRLVAYPPGRGLSETYAGGRWRTFPPNVDVYAAAAARDDPVVLVQRPVLVPGKPGVLRRALRKAAATLAAGLLALLLIAAARCRFTAVRFPASLKATIRDFHKAVRKLVHVTSLVATDLRGGGETPL